MKKTVMLITGVLAMTVVQPVLASDDSRKMHGTHMHGPLHGNIDAKKKAAMDKKRDHEGHMQGDMSQMKNSFMVKKEIDGFTVSFHAMKVAEGMQHGGSHNLMIKVEKNGQSLTDLVVNSKVMHPNGKSESKMLMKMGDWYMAGYDLEHDGEHQLMVLFKTADGKKHFGGVYYPERVDSQSSDEKSDENEHQH